MPGKPTWTWDGKEVDLDAKLDAAQVSALRDAIYDTPRDHMPMSVYEMDLHHLLTLVQSGKQPWRVGAADRLRNIENTHATIYHSVDSQGDLYDSGWAWADRLIEARALLAFMEEGNP